MNAEQLKQLKPGDEIFIRATFVKILDDGDVEFLHTNKNLDDEVVKTEEYTLPSNVILPSELQPAPKHDPCRLFKKGDKVRVVEWNGRTSLRDGQVGFVVKNEEASGMVELSIDGWKNGAFYHACNLELVTPVEETEPYSIGKSDYNGFVNIEKKGKIIAMIPYGKDLHEHKTREEAFAAAEAERDRLNVEYRKEQK